MGFSHPPWATMFLSSRMVPKRALHTVPTAWKNKVWQKNVQCFTYTDSLNNIVKFLTTPSKLPTLIFPPSKLQGWEHVGFPHLGFATYSDSHVAPNRSFLLSMRHSSGQSPQAYIGTGLPVGCSWVPSSPVDDTCKLQGTKEVRGKGSDSKAPRPVSSSSFDPSFSLDTSTSSDYTD